MSWCNLATCSAPTNTPTPTPTPAPSSFTCSISGPTSGTPGQSLTYSSSCNTSAGNLTNIDIYWSPTNSQSWSYVGPGGCAQGGGTNGSCSQVAVFGSPGTYYVTVNGYRNGSNVATGDPTTRCTGNPFPGSPAPGWADCGGPDWIQVTIAPSGPLNHTLTIQSVNQFGYAILGYYTTISPADSTGSTWQYTTAYFNVIDGTSYTVNPQNYAGVNFDHWQDNGNTSPFRTVAITSDTTLVAVYNDTNVPPPPGGGTPAPGDPGSGGSTGAGNYCVGSLDAYQCTLTCNLPSPICDPGTGLCASCCVTTRPASCSGGYATVNAGGGPIPVNDCNNSCDFSTQVCDPYTNSCVPIP